MTVESDELKLKRYEGLYSLARETYAAELQRFDATEAKADRYLAFLLAIFGVTALNIDQFLELASAPTSPWAYAFLVTYCVVAGVAFAALVLILSAISVQRLLGPPSDGTLPDHFRKHRYVDAIYSTSISFFNAAGRAHTITNRKMRAVRHVHWLLLIVLVLAAVAVISFALHKIGDP